MCVKSCKSAIVSLICGAKVSKAKLVNTTCVQIIGSKSKVVYRVVVVLMVLFCLVAIVVKLSDSNSLLSVASRISGRSGALFLLLNILLMLLNFLLEALRWQVLLKSVTDASFSDCLKATFAASAFGSFTPARAGEHFARTLYGKATNAQKVTLSLLASAMMSAVIATGFVISMVLSPITFVLSANSAVLVVCLLALVVAGWVAVLKSRMVRREILLIKRLICNDIRRFSKAFAVTTVRYSVFSLQMLCCLCFLDDGADVLALLTRLPVYYFLITFIPSFFIADLGIKGGAAALVFAPCASLPAIALAVLVVWLVNTALPAIVGSVLALIHVTKTVKI